MAYQQQQVERRNIRKLDEDLEFKVRRNIEVRRRLLKYLRPEQLLSLMPCVYEGTKQEIQKQEINGGTIKAAGMFLDKVPAYSGWSKEFLEALIETDQESLARELSPGFFDHPPSTNDVPPYACRSPPHDHRDSDDQKQKKKDVPMDPPPSYDEATGTPNDEIEIDETTAALIRLIEQQDVDNENTIPKTTGESGYIAEQKKAYSLYQQQHMQKTEIKKLKKKNTAENLEMNHLCYNTGPLTSTTNNDQANQTSLQSRLPTHQSSAVCTNVTSSVSINVNSSECTNSGIRNIIHSLSNDDSLHHYDTTGTLETAAELSVPNHIDRVLLDEPSHNISPLRNDSNTALFPRPNMTNSDSASSGNPNAFNILIPPNEFQTMHDSNADYNSPSKSNLKGGYDSTSATTDEVHENTSACNHVAEQQGVDNENTIPKILAVVDYHADRTNTAQNLETNCPHTNDDYKCPSKFNLNERYESSDAESILHSSPHPHDFSILSSHGNTYIGDILIDSESSTSNVSKSVEKKPAPTDVVNQPQNVLPSSCPGDIAQHPQAQHETSSSGSWPSQSTESSSTSSTSKNIDDFSENGINKEVACYDSGNKIDHTLCNDDGGVPYIQNANKAHRNGFLLPDAELQDVSSVVQRPNPHKVGGGDTQREASHASAPLVIPCSSSGSTNDRRSLNGLQSSSAIESSKVSHLSDVPCQNRDVSNNLKASTTTTTQNNVPEHDTSIISFLRSTLGSTILPKWLKTEKNETEV